MAQAFTPGVLYRGVVANVSPKRDFGFIKQSSIFESGGEIVRLPSARDIWLHVGNSPKLGAEVPPEGAVLEFYLTSNGGAGLLERFAAVDARAVPKETLARERASRYRGRIKTVSGSGELGFIDIKTIAGIGDAVPLPIREDLQLHVKYSPLLGEPLLQGAWLTFSIRLDLHTRSRSGYEAQEGAYEIATDTRGGALWSNSHYRT
ncbi:MAG TPA: hypothetical protein VG753_01740 [Candidatus Paceibacterota bacterium]|nr:hypothetical protein [Candidatus Paceibacterota bacterium]